MANKLVVNDDVTGIFSRIDANSYVPARRSGTQNVITAGAGAATPIVLATPADIGLTPLEFTAKYGENITYNATNVSVDGKTGIMEGFNYTSASPQFCYQLFTTSPGSCQLIRYATTGGTGWTEWKTQGGDIDAHNANAGAHANGIAGNAATATKAMQDAKGNDINKSYPCAVGLGKGCIGVSAGNNTWSPFPLVRGSVPTPNIQTDALSGILQSDGIVRILPKSISPKSISMFTVMYMPDGTVSLSEYTHSQTDFYCSARRADHSMAVHAKGPAGSFMELYYTGVAAPKSYAAPNTQSYAMATLTNGDILCVPGPGLSASLFKADLSCETISIFPAEGGTCCGAVVLDNGDVLCVPTITGKGVLYKTDGTFSLTTSTFTFDGPCSKVIKLRNGSVLCIPRNPRTRGQIYKPDGTIETTAEFLFRALLVGAHLLQDGSVWCIPKSKNAATCIYTESGAIVETDPIPLSGECTATVELRNGGLLCVSTYNKPGVAYLAGVTVQSAITDENGVRIATSYPCAVGLDNRSIAISNKEKSWDYLPLTATMSSTAKFVKGGAPAALLPNGDVLLIGHYNNKGGIYKTNGTTTQTTSTFTLAVCTTSARLTNGDILCVPYQPGKGNIYKTDGTIVDTVSIPTSNCLTSSVLPNGDVLCVPYSIDSKGALYKTDGTSTTTGTLTFEGGGCKTSVTLDDGSVLCIPFSSGKGCLYKANGDISKTANDFTHETCSIAVKRHDGSVLCVPTRSGAEGCIYKPDGTIVKTEAFTFEGECNQAVLLPNGSVLCLPCQSGKCGCIYTTLGTLRKTSVFTFDSSGVTFVCLNNGKVLGAPCADNVAGILYADDLISSVPLAENALKLGERAAASYPCAVDRVKYDVPVVGDGPTWNYRNLYTRIEKTKVTFPSINAAAYITRKDGTVVIVPRDPGEGYIYANETITRTAKFISEGAFSTAVLLKNGTDILAIPSASGNKGCILKGDNTIVQTPPLTFEDICATAQTLRNGDVLCIPKSAGAKGCIYKHDGTVAQTAVFNFDDTSLSSVLLTTGDVLCVPWKSKAKGCVYKKDGTITPTEAFTFEGECEASILLYDGSVLCVPFYSLSKGCIYKRGGSIEQTASFPSGEGCALVLLPNNDVLTIPRITGLPGTIYHLNGTIQLAAFTGLDVLKSGVALADGRILCIPVGNSHGLLYSHGIISDYGPTATSTIEFAATGTAKASASYAHSFPLGTGRPNKDFSYQIKGASYSRTGTIRDGERLYLDDCLQLENAVLRCLVDDKAKIVTLELTPANNYEITFTGSITGLVEVL